MEARSRRSRIIEPLPQLIIPPWCRLCCLQQTVEPEQETVAVRVLRVRREPPDGRPAVRLLVNGRQHAQGNAAALNTSLLDAWASAWKKCQDLKNDAEESRRSPDAVVLGRLAEYTIKSTLHPYVEVCFGPKMLQKITFEVTLATQIKGLVLGLKNGRVVSIQLAQCQWTGSIGTRGVTLVKRKLTTLDFPGRITLKHGIPLGPQSHD